MLLSFNMRALLCSFFFNIFSSGASETVSIHLRRDEPCVQYFRNDEQHSMLQTVRSRIECAIECAGNRMCHYFRLRDNDGGLSCELVLSQNPLSQCQQQDVTVYPSPVPGLQCYKVLSSCSDDSLWNYCYKDHDPDLKKSSWVTFADTDDLNTQSVSYLNAHATQIKDAKLIFLDNSGMYYAYNAFHYFNNGVSTVTFAYAMQKDDHGFTDGASRVLLSCTANGMLNLVGIEPDGATSSTTFTVPAKIIYQNISQHLIESEDTETIIALIEQGYSMTPAKSHVSIENDGLAISQFEINRRIQLDASRKLLDIPLRFWQQMQVMPFGYYRLKNFMGKVSDRPSGWTESSEIYVKFETLWKPIGNYTADPVTIFDSVSLLLIQGHRFRLNYDREYFDVSDIIREGDDIHFILPQQVIMSFHGPFADVHIGLRSAVSVRGYNSWCSHPLEGEQVLNNGSQYDLKIQAFVDQKAWTAVFSVYSDGTVAFGCAQDVADAALAGKDMNVLIEWLEEDKVRMLSVDLMTVKDDGLTSVLVAAESKVTWHLVTNQGGNLTINSRCDMEKVLVKTNGQCQVLVYNIHSRQPVMHITEIKTVWLMY